MAAALVFPSKVDTWLVVVLAAAILIGAALPAWLLMATHYTLEDTELRVRSGPFRWSVPIREITAITPTRNPLSSPALSLDRLRIDYGRGRSLMISPADKDGFLRELERRRKTAAR